jgi:hypothetical protein
VPIKSRHSAEKLRGGPICRVTVRSAKSPLVAFCVGKCTAFNASRIGAKVFLESVDAKSRLILQLQRSVEIDF